MKTPNTKEIIELLMEYRDDELLLDLIVDTVTSCSAYADTVVRQMMASNTALISPSPSRAQELERYDRARRTAHEALISTVRAMNRFLRTEGKPLFYHGDESDRYEIADFAIVVSETIAKEEIKRTRYTVCKG